MLNDLSPSLVTLAWTNREERKEESRKGWIYGWMDGVIGRTMKGKGHEWMDEELGPRTFARKLGMLG